MGKREKTLFLDIDEVFTTSGKPDERKTVDSAVERLVKAREVGYTRFAFITARSGNWVLREFVPHLEKHSLLRNSTIHCENGLYEIVNGKFSLLPEAQEFLKVRERVTKAILQEARKQKVGAIDAAQKMEKFVQARVEPKRMEDMEKLGKTCSEVIGKLAKQGKIPKTVGIDATKSGINIFPRNITKGTTARAI
ncbi:MAG: hypothetical protein JW744_00095, partial [Candidatus Diapherotrites archaeon]|nr:hypothetical protein [Candidatus Diapherotrites archaeon]